MISVTGEYLIGIVERHLNKTIALRRKAAGVDDGADLAATNEEIADFILSIPFFHDGLKDFIMGNTPVQTIIVSQPWEIAFMIRTKKWAESQEWLQSGSQPGPKFYLASPKVVSDSLNLPY
ncbi:MAG: hypothetical protein EOO03_03615 [Chitinophagaceae bacterium]|nr:MAG: hypothetical protein EOO03_03615 [Chitinophagaceae bacterium]